jgi:hypothetical protein
MSSWFSSCEEGRQVWTRDSDWHTITLKLMRCAAHHSWSASVPGLIQGYGWEGPLGKDDPYVEFYFGFEPFLIKYTGRHESFSTGGWSSLISNLLFQLIYSRDGDCGQSQAIHRDRQRYKSTICERAVRRIVSSTTYEFLKDQIGDERIPR